MKIKIVKRQGCGCEAYPFCEHASTAISPSGGDCETLLAALKTSLAGGAR